MEGCEQEGARNKVKREEEEWSEKRKFEVLTENVAGFREKEAEKGVVLWLHGDGYWLTSVVEWWMDIVRARVGVD